MLQKLAIIITLSAILPLEAHAQAHPIVTVSCLEQQLLNVNGDWRPLPEGKGLIIVRYGEPASVLKRTSDLLDTNNSYYSAQVIVMPSGQFALQVQREWTITQDNEATPDQFQIYGTPSATVEIQPNSGRWTLVRPVQMAYEMEVLKETNQYGYPVFNPTQLHRRERTYLMCWNAYLPLERLNRVR